MSKPRPPSPLPRLEDLGLRGGAPGGVQGAEQVAAGALREALALLAHAHDLADAPLSPLEVQGLLILVEGRLRRGLATLEAQGGGAVPT
jgi:hypothetical protein